MRVLPVTILASAACWSSAPKTPAPPSPKPPAEIPITEDHFGPLDAQSPATLVAMRKYFPEYSVAPVNDPDLEYYVRAGSAVLFYVVPTDENSGVFNVHALDGRAVDRDHGWRAGATFQDSSKLDFCECWGEHPTCYKRGEHVAVNFDRECEGITGAVEYHAYKALDGLALRTVIWNPQPFGSDQDPDGEEGGVEGGVVGGSAGSDDPPPPEDSDDGD